jgi:hypothetical protein
VLVVVEVAAGQDQVADAGPAQVEILRHRFAEIADLVPYQAPHRVGYGGHHGVVALVHALQLPQQAFLAAVLGEAVSEQAKDVGMAGHALVRQCHQAAAQVADGWHAEGLAEDGGTAAGVERRHHVDRVVGEALEHPADPVQGGPAAEKQNAGAQLGCPVVAADTHRVRDSYTAGDANCAHNE